MNGQGAKMSSLRINQTYGQRRDSEAEAKQLFRLLNAWKDESQMQFSKIVDHFNPRITEDITELSKEVSDLQGQLSVSTKERSCYLETIDNLNNEIKELNEKLTRLQSHPPVKEICNKATQYNPEVISPISAEESSGSHVIHDSDDDEYLDLETDGYITNKPFERHISHQTCKNELIDSTLNDEAHEDIIEIERNEEETEGKFIGSREDQQKAGLTEDVNCPTCNIIFSTRANLLVHSLNFHSNLPASNESAASTLKESEAMGLESSITKLHSDTESGDDTGTNLSIDSIPLRTSGTAYNISRHKFVSREGRFSCEQCPYSAKHFSSIKSHVKEVHDKIRDHVCNVCGYATTRKRSLLRHFDAVHKKGEKRFKCEHCPYSSAEKAKVKYHKASVHNIGEKFRCEKCNYASARKDELKRHAEEKHEGIKRHVCAHCGYATTRHKLLEKHRKSVHDIEGKIQ